MTSTVTPVGLLLETLGSMPNLVTEDRAPLTARVLEVRDATTARVRILGLTLDIQSPIPVKAGMLLKVVPEQVDGQVRLVLLPGATGEPAQPLTGSARPGPTLLTFPADPEPELDVMHDARAVITRALGDTAPQPTPYARAIAEEAYGALDAAAERAALTPPETANARGPMADAALANAAAAAAARPQAASATSVPYHVQIPGLPQPLLIEVWRDAREDEGGEEAHASSASGPVWSVRFGFKDDAIGLVQTLIQQSHAGIRVDLHAERADTASLLHAELSELRDVLALADLTVEDVAVTTDAAFTRLVEEND